MVLGLPLFLLACAGSPEPKRGSAGTFAPLAASPESPPALPPLFDDIERRAFRYFWDTTNPDNGLAPDRHPSRPFSSIAAVGFALTAYPIGIENGWVDRDQAIERTLKTLEFFRDAPQGPQPQGTSGYKGFYYHFLDMQTGHRINSNVELSSIDTSLLMMGVLFAQSYYDGDDPREAQIREIAEQLYAGIDWNWMQRNAPLVSMGWHPEKGFIDNDWKGFDEAMFLYVLALGSPSHPVEPEAWQAWARTYDRVWGEFQRQEYLSFAPQFGHQYSQSWIDFRGIRDAFMRDKEMDYFENSRRATLAQQAYAVANPMGWRDYGENVWGLTACDGPGTGKHEYQGEIRDFRGYSARGPGLSVAFDDGTLAPTAAVASLPFAPELVIPATEEMQRRYGEHIYAEYGFLDSFNPSFRYDVPVSDGQVIPGFGWVAGDYIGIDQGPILLMIANYRNGFVWDVMKRNPHIRTGLERAGFTGGWLENDTVDSGPNG
ncbi:hypothetical protein CSC70_07635 [Pseudoxanthomonas kalamensis DSM 18571]|nr:hypothetical protein CSC70_07635 [Pseudoxanthomonas kalamensis DSM 18571]